MQERVEKIEWRDIPGYEGLYQASRCGMIKRLAAPTGVICRPMMKVDKILVSTPAVGCYGSVQLRKNGSTKPQMVHRLVALAFVENPDNKPIVNHKDRNKTNNHASNLEWCTHKENSEHWAMMDRMDLDALGIGKQVRVHGTDHTARITGKYNRWIYISPTLPGDAVDEFYFYKQLELI